MPFNTEYLARFDTGIPAAPQRAVDRSAGTQRRFAEEDGAICSAELRWRGREITELHDATREGFAEATRAEVDIT